MLNFPSAFKVGVSESEIRAYLKDWTLEQSSSGTSKLCRSFLFETFEDCIQFMNLLMADIKELDHHPRWTNSYNQLHVVLTSWDAGSIVSLKDYKLAFTIDYHFNQFYKS
jgi:4a-hydroxytetrahydrobiopterin dehydratase